MRGEHKVGFRGVVKGVESGIFTGRDIMRGASITSVLLTAVLAASASACLAGFGSRHATVCDYPVSRDHCVRTKGNVAATLSASCGHTLTSVPAQCGLRSFLSLPFVVFRSIEIATPLQVGAGNISAPSDSKIIIFSIGSPQTDRGPPLS